jgi:hypothetical protein
MLSASFWSAIQNEAKAGIWPFVFLILSLSGIAGMYLQYRSATNTAAISKEIERIVSEEKNKLLQVLNKEKKEKEVEIVQMDIDAKLSSLIPKGNFKTMDVFAKKLLDGFASEVQMVRGAFYLYDSKSKLYNFLAGYALTGETVPSSFKVDENLTGAAAKTAELMIVSDIPEDYFETESGLGKSKPKFLAILPVVNEKRTIAVIEIATFIDMGHELKELLSRAAVPIGEKTIQLLKSQIRE